jgi:lactate dehydrogenase-like 2-hydroxyacid dehydrogenase
MYIPIDKKKDPIMKDYNSSTQIKKIAVTELEYKKARKIFDLAKDYQIIPAPAEEDKLVTLLQREKVDHIIIGVDKYLNSLYNVLPKNGVIARFGVGYDGVDIQKAIEKGILCTNTPGALDDSVAEHTMNLLLAASRSTINIGGKMRSGIWEPSVGCELKGKKLAVIGLGPIGRRVAQIASYGFKMIIYACEINDIDDQLMRNEFGIEKVEKSFESVVSDAEYITLHIPVNNQTKYFINADRLKSIPQHSWLINTSRGSIVDENALFTALSANKLKGAALDVFEYEPYQPVKPGMDLRTLDNVIMTPHVSSSTREACEKMAKQCLQNIRFADNGEFDKMNLLNIIS